MAAVRRSSGGPGYFEVRLPEDTTPPHTPVPGHQRPGQAAPMQAGLTQAAFPGASPWKALRHLGPVGRRCQPCEWFNSKFLTGNRGHLSHPEDAQVTLTLLPFAPRQSHL